MMEKLNAQLQILKRLGRREFALIENLVKRIQNVVKRRHLVRIGKTRFEIDVFAGEHRGLVIAEVELASPRSPFERPKWLGKEITGKRRYYNNRLARAT